MGIPNISTLVQACIYLLIVILSFFVCVPAGVNSTDFNGHCLLYASGTWTMKSQPELRDVKWGPDSACNFTIFIGVMSLVLSMFYLIWLSIQLARGTESSWLDAFINLVVNAIMCICIFSTALAVSIGFQEWCELVTDSKSGVKNCEDGQYMSIGGYLNINTADYYLQWEIVQFGIWSSWLSWLSLTVLSLIRLYRYHRQEAFTTSMNRERQRLLSRVQRQGAEPM